MAIDIDKLIEKAVAKGLQAGRKETGKDVIRKAVTEALEAGKKETEKRVKNIYKATEKLLYALPDLKEKALKDKEYLKSLKEHGLSRHSGDIVRFKKAGVRLDDEEILDGVIQDIIARIAANEFEIDRIEKALEPLTRDPYFKVISSRYFENLHDEKIAEQIHCDPSTVRRNRGRLIHRISVRLFGSEAL